jgi:hypothetical protein
MGGQLCGDWENLSRGDVRLFRKTVKEGWPVPPENRRPLLDAVFAHLSREDTPIRLALAILEFLVAVDMHNLEVEQAARKAAQLNLNRRRAREEADRQRRQNVQSPDVVRQLLQTPEGRAALLAYTESASAALDSQRVPLPMAGDPRPTDPGNST